MPCYSIAVRPPGGPTTRFNDGQHDCWFRQNDAFDAFDRALSSSPAGSKVALLEDEKETPIWRNVPQPLAPKAAVVDLRRRIELRRADDGVLLGWIIGQTAETLHFPGPTEGTTFNRIVLTKERWVEDGRERPVYSITPADALIIDHLDCDVFERAGLLAASDCERST